MMLSQRKAAAPQEAEMKVVDAKPLRRNSTEASIDAAVETAASYVPEKYQGHVRKAAPALKAVAAFIEFLFPYLVKVYDFGLMVWAKLQPYHPEEFLPALAGLTVAFFGMLFVCINIFSSLKNVVPTGGHFLTTIAAVEAFRMAGYARILECLKDLRTNYYAVKEASEKDDTVDEDNDGIADVLQISTKELAQRKLRLLLISCDPVVVSNAVSGIYSGCFAVVATLRVQFARTITLGCSIGDFMHKGLDTYARGSIEAVTPPEYRKWISPALQWFCKSVGVSIAWTVQRIISAFHSAIRGGDLFARGLSKYLTRQGYYSGIKQGSLQFNAIAGATAVLGFYWQASSWFQLPFPLNILLLPLRILEWFLVWIVAVEG